jgi:hypothetical protein
MNALPHPVVDNPPPKSVTRPSSAAKGVSVGLLIARAFRPQPHPLRHNVGAIFFSTQRLLPPERFLIAPIDNPRATRNGSKWLLVARETKGLCADLDRLRLAGGLNVAQPHGLGAEDQDGPALEGLSFVCQIRYQKAPLAIALTAAASARR